MRESLLSRLLVALPCLVAAQMWASVAAVAQDRRFEGAPQRPVVDVVDRNVLGALEGRGFGFGARLGAPRTTNLATLSRESAGYRALVATVAADVREVRADLLRQGRRLYEETDDNVGRVIDLAWLSANVARFDLVGIVNRIDRRDFDAGPEARCGEVRLIYRLAYRFAARPGRGERASRMPFNVNLVYGAPGEADPTCGGTARAWLPPPSATAEETAAWLVSGPLATMGHLLRVEINAQIVRFPSGQETTFGGQALYLLRVFRPSADEASPFVPAPLENTPDVARIAADAALRARLVAFVRNETAAIDRGVYRLPDEFLATRAISFSTFGSARTANHPFNGIVSEADFADLPSTPRTTALSPRGLIERLNNGTCAGCHQANATAGFHLFGFDDGSTAPLNVVAQAVSPHLHAERARRTAYVGALAAGQAPETFRPLSFAPPMDWSGPGVPRPTPAPVTMPCVPPASRADLHADAGCEAGSVCRVLALNDRLAVPLGQCVREGERGMFSGHACLVGRIDAGRAPVLDRFAIVERFNSPAPTMSRTAYNCRPPVLGVPGGIAYRQCDTADRDFAGFRGGAFPNEICAFAGGRAFDACVATQDFASCIGNVVVRGNRTACGGDRFCREDYICQNLPPGLPNAERLPAGIGFCTPTYFLFQMRIDNHPNPRRG